MAKKKRRKRQSKKQSILPILLSVLGVSIGLVLIGYFVYQDYKFKEPLQEEWGQSYYAYIKDDESIKKMESSEVRFIKTKAHDNVMIVNYRKDSKDYSNVYYLEDDKIKSIIYDKPSNVVLLYNLELEEYNYYFNIKDDSKEYYQAIDAKIELDRNDEPSEEFEYFFDYDEKEKSYENKDGEVLSFKSFDKTFMKINEEEKYTNISNLNGIKLKDAMKESIGLYIPLNKIINSDVKESVKKHVDDVRTFNRLEEEEEIEGLYSKLNGIWYYEKESWAFTIQQENGKRVANWGWFASEAFVKAPIKEVIKNKDGIYEFHLSSTSNPLIKIDISDINKKKIKIDGYTHKYVGADWDEAYDELLY